MRRLRRDRAVDLLEARLRPGDDRGPAALERSRVAVAEPAGDEHVHVARVVATERERDQVGTGQGRAVDLRLAVVAAGRSLRHATEAPRQDVRRRRARAREGLPHDPVRRAHVRVRAVQVGPAARSRAGAARCDRIQRLRVARRPHPGRVRPGGAVTGWAALEEWRDTLAGRERVAECHVAVRGGDGCERRCERGRDGHRSEEHSGEGKRDDASTPWGGHVHAAMITATSLSANEFCVNRQTHAMATMADLNELALALPETACEVSDDGRPAYTVHGKAFAFHRSQRADAVDADTGERLDDVLMFRVGDLDEKQIRLSDDRGIYFTTPHFNNYPAVLVRIPDLATARPRGAARSRRRGLADAGAEARREGLARGARRRRRLASGADDRRRPHCAARSRLPRPPCGADRAWPQAVRLPRAPDRREADLLPGQAEDRDEGVRAAPLRTRDVAAPQPEGDRRAHHRLEHVLLGVLDLQRRRPRRGAARAPRHLRALRDRHGRDDLPARAARRDVPAHGRAQLDRDRHRARRH